MEIHLRSQEPAKGLAIKMLVLTTQERQVLKENKKHFYALHI
jgi:hypothetical protein